MAYILWYFFYKLYQPLIIKKSLIRTSDAIALVLVFKLAHEICYLSSTGKQDCVQAVSRCVIKKATGNFATKQRTACTFDTFNGAIIIISLR